MNGMAAMGKKKGCKESERSEFGDFLVLSAVGDVFLGGTIRLIQGRTVESDEKQSKATLDKVLPYFRASDVNFCNLEGTLSDQGMPQPGRSAALRGYPSGVETLKKAKIDFVSVANNHVMDYGWEAFADTLERLTLNKIGFSGGGKDIEAARTPALVKKKGMTIGLLSYTCNVNVPLGFQAADGKPGLAPIRISPFFWPDHTNKQDIKALRQDIEKWRKQVDFLAVSVHWGVSESGTYTTALHQQSIAHQAIDAGADLILGHHPHAIQGIELYKDKPICYSLGHFALDFFLDEEGFPRETMLFQCRISPHHVEEASFLPAFISPKKGQPEVLLPNEGKGLEIVSLMRELSSEFGTKLTIKGGAVEIALKRKGAGKR
jgi:poly-gamma-glutamate capsule biosynthesis protein CapA/YwtB (metallophosphatase superfamily)